MKKKEMTSKALKRNLMLLGILTCAFLMTGCGAKTIQIEDYLSVQYKGLNMRGKAKLDDSALKDEVEAIVYKNAKKDESVSSTVSDVMQACRLTLSQEENLSNGDVVEVEALINNELCKAAKIKFQFGKYSDTVSGLKEVPVYTDKDLFSALRIVSSGVSPEVKLSFDAESEDPNLAEMKFHGDRSVQELKKGEKITIICDAHDTDRYLIDENATLKTEYVVEDVAEYINTADQVTKKVLEAAQPAAEEKVKETLTNTGMSYIVLYDRNTHNRDNVTPDTLTNIRLSKMLLLTPKEGTSVKDHNYIMLVYSFDATCTDRNGHTEQFSFTDAVVGAVTRNIYVNPDGTVEKQTYDMVRTTGKYSDYEDWYSYEMKDYVNKYDIVEIPIDLE